MIKHTKADEWAGLLTKAGFINCLFIIEKLEEISEIVGWEN